MTAREKLRRIAQHFGDFAGLPDTDGRVERLLDACDTEHRAEVRGEAADFVRDAHFRDGLSVQEIGTALRFMADAATPTSEEPQR